MLMRGEPFIVPTVELPLNIKDAMILKVFRVICYRSLRKLGGFLYGGRGIYTLRRSTTI